jgi:hypothetical protein
LVDAVNAFFKSLNCCIKSISLILSEILIIIERTLVSEIVRLALYYMIVLNYRNIIVVLIKILCELTLISHVYILILVLVLLNLNLVWLLQKEILSNYLLVRVITLHDLAYLFVSFFNLHFNLLFNCLCLRVLVVLSLWRWGSDWNWSIICWFHCERYHTSSNLNSLCAIYI